MSVKKILSLILTAASVCAVALSGGCSSQNGYVALPHYDTLDGSYETDLMYSNLLKINQGDPGALWVSEEDDPVYGGYCYVAVTSLNNTDENYRLNDDSKYKAVAFEIHRSKDLSDWEVCGALDGSGFGIEKGSWIDTWTWAPELWRDDLTGKYFLYFSARAADSVDSVKGTENDRHCLAVAMSDTPFGPYELATSQKYYQAVAEAYAEAQDGEVYVEDGKLYGGDTYITDVDGRDNYLNGNGESITLDTPTINFNSPAAREHISESVGEVRMFPAIDANFFRAENGDMYLYFVSHQSTFKSGISDTNYVNPDYSGPYSRDWSHQYNNNEIWGMKMKDLITPDFSTLQVLATPRYKSVRAQEETVNGVRKVSIDPRNYERTGEFFEIGEGNNVNEGPHMIENEGKFYLTYSPTGTGNVLYSVSQAVSDSPLGPFEKLVDCNPVIGITDTTDNISGTGHHSFVRIGDEIWALYHCFWQEMTASGGRCIAADRVRFLYNDELGYKILYGDGPTLSVQPVNVAASGLTNVAATAHIEVSGSGAKETVGYLTDGYFPAQPFGADREFTASDEVTVTFSWDTPQEIRAVFVYNSADYYRAFTKVDSIKFDLAESPDWTDKVVSGLIIENLMCNPANVNENELCMRNGGAAIAGFRPIKVTRVSVTVSEKYTYEFEDGASGRNKNLGIAEIYLSGREA